MMINKQLWIIRILLLALAFGQPFPSQANEHIATLEHETPIVIDYKIKATIPVPQGTFRESDMLSGASPFSIQNSDGSIRMLQVTGVTKYANAAQDGYDIVSVVGSVKKQNTPVSSFKIFKTSNQGASWPTQLPSTAKELVQDAPLSIHPNILPLFSSNNKLIAEAQDVFGHIYRCDLGNGTPKIYSYGPEQLVFRAACIMTPVNPVPGSQGTLPHLMGVLGYFVINSNEEALRLTLVATNSVSGSPLNGGSTSAVALKDIFFKFLHLKVAGDYGTTYVWETPVTTPSTFDGSATTIPLIPARSDGKMQWLRTRWEYPFEFSLHTKSATGIAQGQYLANYNDIAFAVEGNSTTNNYKLYSPHNIKTARYGITTRTPWPTLYHLGISNVKNSLDNSYNTTYNRFKSGMCPLKTVTDATTGISTTTCDYPYLGSNTVINPNGPNPHTIPTSFFAPVPWGVQYGGMTSGSEIRPGGTGFDVWAARSRKGALNLYLYTSSRLLRQEVLRKLDGELVSPMDAVVQGPNGPFVPVRAFGGYNPSYCPACDSLFGFNNAPSFQTTYVINNNLLPDYYNVIKGFMQEDEQHKVRTTNGLYAVLQLMAHPRSIDMTLAEGYYSYFANPNLPQYYAGTTPKFQPAHLGSFRKVTPATGTLVGRDFAHTQMARVMAYAVGDSSFRNFMLPYHQYVMREIMARSQMWHGKLINKAAFSKTSPTGNCNVAISREENFLILANMATRERIFRKMSPASSGLTKRVLTKSVQSILNLDLIWPQNNWASQFSNVMVAGGSNPNQIFSNWNDVPAACKTDAFNGGPDAGEFHLTIAAGSLLDHNTALWQALKSSLHKIKPTPTSTLGKLQALSHYDLSSTNNVANLGFCQVKEQQSPGYCG